ncbi:hypothetical protein TL16_g08378 [Triparma laevis f. inornata]|uniref:Uncharacterized protein n=1 Tax=Triparma laevis f. inornata TaxID=1714386 RepID=A0A9W7EIC5_9STRA|nr:hypothetical protein TL16_g08378 [Triparma laevis f. inornata]
MEPGYDLEAGVINKPTVFCSAGHALLEDILCLQELQKQHPWFETMISEIQKVHFFTRNHVVMTPLEHMDEDGAMKMGTSFVPSLRMKSQPAGGVLMWVNQYPALKELSQKHKFLIPMFNAIAVHILMNAPWGVKLRAGFGAALSVFDAFTDVFMLIRYLGEEGYQDYAIITGVLLGMSMVLQFFVVVFQNSKAKHPFKTIAYETLPIIFCLKPVVDAYRVATSHQMEKHKRFDQLTEMGMTRGVEMFSESIPQAILQTYVYISIVQTRDFSGSFAILLTIFSSVLSASYCSANMSYDFDISPKSRAKNERFYGYIPDAAKGRTIVFFSLIASSSFHLLLKCVSSALLCTMGFKYVGMFILGDILFFFAYKLARRDFYHWIPMDNEAMTIFVTVMLRAVIKIITDFTAIVQFRNSVDLGGAFWTFSQIMSQAGAFVIVWVYFSTDHSAGWDNGQEDRFWMVMFALLLGYLVSIAAFLSNIKSEFFHTFFNINTAYGEIRANFFEGGDEAKCEAVFTNR